MKLIHYISCIIVLTLLSCTMDNNPPPMVSNTPDPEQRQKDQMIIADYVQKNNLKTNITKSGLHYIIKSEGNKLPPEAYGTQARIVAHYHGTFLNGKVFDSSKKKGKPFAFKLGTVIPGWREAIRLMGVGGSATFIVPSHLAYGQNGIPGRIQPNTILVFDIDLLTVGE